MDRDQLRDIVREQVRRALGGEGADATTRAGWGPQTSPIRPLQTADGADGEDGGPTVVAVICGGRGGLSKALEQTKAVAKQVDVIGLMSPAAKEFIGEDRLRSEGGIREIVTLESGMSPGELVDRADIVLVAQLTRTTLARIGLGLSDSLPSSVVLTALWDGTPVVVARDGVDPDLAARDPEKAADAPRELARLYAEYLTRVESFGCAVIAAEQIADTVLSMLTGREPRLERAMKQRRVITEEDVRRAARRGESISVARAIVTPLARDVAKEMGVELLEE